MRPRDHDLARQLETSLLRFDRQVRSLPGIRDSANRRSIVEQMLESIHRVNYVAALRKRNLSNRRADPNDEMFDPLKAAILHKRNGNVQEAFWLVFLFVHFGKHRRAGWRYVRQVYGRLGDQERWDWARISSEPAAFRTWLHAHQDELKRKGLPGGFGNHRKYESLDPYSLQGTGNVVETYVRWVGPPRSHQELVEQIYEQANRDSGKAFDMLYKSMHSVARFGRTARFDYLTMLGKLGLAQVEPRSAYLADATGPLRGAQLLFGVNEKATILDGWLAALGSELKVGMQVIEDSLCNWQKSPEQFKPFRG